MAKKQKDEDLQVMVLFEKEGLRILRYPEDDAERDELYFQLFSERDDQGYYDSDDLTEKMLSLLDKASKGDKGAAKTFINLRCGNNCEYETFQIYTVE